MSRALVLLSLCFASCGIRQPPPIDVRVEVWNQTLDPIFLVDQQGTRLDVAACGFAAIPSFRINAFQVFTDRGLWFSHEVHGSGLPAQRYIISATPGFLPDYLAEVSAGEPAPSLPPCANHPVIPSSNAPAN